jgi:hypothetical protein
LRLCGAGAGVKLNFVAKSEKGPQFLRDGSVDLEIGAEKYGAGNSAAGAVSRSFCWRWLKHIRWRRADKSLASAMPPASM